MTKLIEKQEVASDFGAAANLTALVRDGLNDLPRLTWMLNTLIAANPEGLAESMAEFMIDAKKDRLTGLFTKAHFEDEVSCDERRIIKGNVLLMIDLDNFKPVNDNYGHATGDRLLAKVGEMLRDTVRKTDVVGRLGGDEFGVLLRGTDEKSAMQVVEKITQALSGGLELEHNGTRIPVHGSIGMHIVKEGQSSSEALIAADMEMYKIKNNKPDARKPAPVAALAAAMR